MSEIHVKPIGRWVYVLGRNPERTLLRLSVDGASDFIEWVIDALPAARKVDLAGRRATLASAQRDLVAARERVAALKRRVELLAAG